MTAKTGVFVVATLGYTQYLAIAAVVAPLLLLRTHESIDKGLWYARYLPDLVFSLDAVYWRAHRKLRRLGYFSRTVLLLALLLLSAVASKVAGTIVVVLAQPVRSLAAIPANWRRVTLCTDVAATPELDQGWSRKGFNGLYGSHR